MAFPYDYFNFQLYNFEPLQFNYVLKTGASVLPVTVADAKYQSRIDPLVTTEDAFLTRYITASVNAAENYMRRDLINKTYYAYIDRFPSSSCTGMQLQKSKLQSITAIEYLVDGVYQTLSSANYFFTNDTDYSTIYLLPNNQWPNNLDIRKQAVRITFISGYGVDATYVPEEIKIGLLNHTTFMYQQRGDSGDAGFASSIPQLALDIYDQFKIYSLGVISFT